MLNVIMLNVFMLNVIMLNVFVLNAIMLNVVAPLKIVVRNVCECDHEMLYFCEKNDKMSQGQNIFGPFGNADHL
jgi:hypothetical protein